MHKNCSDVIISPFRFTIEHYFCFIETRPDMLQTTCKEYVGICFINGVKTLKSDKIGGVFHVQCQPEGDVFHVQCIFLGGVFHVQFFWRVAHFDDLYLCVANTYRSETQCIYS